MNVIKASTDLSKSEIYKMTHDPKVKKIKEAGGEVLTLKGFIHYTDVNSNGDEVELLSINTEEGVYATNSKTFIAQFLDLMDYSEKEDMPVHRFEVLEDKSKAGRTFYQCSYVD